MQLPAHKHLNKAIKEQLNKIKFGFLNNYILVVACIEKTLATYKAGGH